MENSTYQPRNLLVTGATGFLGKQFIRDLLSKTEDNIYLVVRDGATSGIPARNRPELDQIFDGDKDFKLRKEDTLDKRLYIIPGDITQEGVIKKYDYAQLPNIDEIWHVAASVQFSGNEEQERRIAEQNIGGTQNMINLAKQLQPEKFFNVSTAYVVGTAGYSGTGFMEQTEFRNIYEKTKYEAEKLVRENLADKAVFLRPGIIVGNSKTGESDDKTIYSIIGATYGLMDVIPRMMRSKVEKHLQEKHTLLKWFFENTPIYLQGNPDSKKNIIPVDDVSGLMVQAQKYGKIGETYNLVSPNDTCVKEIHESLAEAFQEVVSPNLPLDFVRLIPDKGELQRTIATVAENASPVIKPALRRFQKVLEVPTAEYGEYLNSHDALFNRDSTVRDLYGDDFQPQFMTTDLQKFLYSAKLREIKKMKGAKS